MFWKKKNKDKIQSKGFIAPQFGPREAFRVRPSLDEPVFIIIDYKTSSVFDISSGGVSFSNAGFTLHKTYAAKFDLPDDELEIETKLLVVRIKNDDICYGQFIDMPQKIEDRIHDYILQRQKDNMQSGKPPSW